MEMLEFENTSALDIALAEKVVAMLAADIESSGTGSLVVSGGRTPMGLFHLLSQQQLDWSAVTITLADERWVDNQHKDSNEKLVRENLLINEAHRANFIPLKNSAVDAKDGEADFEQALASTGRFTGGDSGYG
jgi:6-phosphogluconolactonase